MGTHDQLIKVYDEMLEALYDATGEKQILDYDSLTVEQLRERITELARLINSLSVGLTLKSIVNSIFDTLTLDEVYEKLKAFNKIKMPPELRYRDFSKN